MWFSRTPQFVELQQRYEEEFPSIQELGETSEVKKSSSDVKASRLIFEQFTPV